MKRYEIYKEGRYIGFVVAATWEHSTMVSDDSFFNQDGLAVASFYDVTIMESK